MKTKLNGRLGKFKSTIGKKNSILFGHIVATLCHLGHLETLNCKLVLFAAYSGNETLPLTIKTTATYNESDGVLGRRGALRGQYHPGLHARRLVAERSQPHHGCSREARSRNEASGRWAPQQGTHTTWKHSGGASYRIRQWKGKKLENLYINPFITIFHSKYLKFEMYN